MLKIFATLLVLIAFFFGAFYLDRPQEPADLVFVNRGDNHTLDPQRMSWLQDFRIAYNIYEGLVRADNDTFAIVPSIAKSWDISTDGTIYTFHLRKNAKWSNGDPVTARDFAYSWKRALLPDTAADYTDLFFRIKNGEAFFNRRGELLKEYKSRPADQRTEQAALDLRTQTDQLFRQMVGIKVIDDYTLQVTLERPTPYMLDLFAFPVFYPVHKDTVEKWMRVDAPTGAIQQQFGWTKPPYFVGNGPYMITRWRYKRDLRLERNPYYWDPDRVVSDSVESVSIEDPSTAVLAFDTGSIDWLSDVSGVSYRADMLAQYQKYMERNRTRYDQLRDSFIQNLQNKLGKNNFNKLYASRLNDRFLGYDEIMAQLAKESPPLKGERNDIHAFPAYGTYFYNFNCSEKFSDGSDNPFHDARVRRAFAMAVNKNDIVKQVTRMNQPVASTFIPPGSIPGYNSPKGVAYDPAQAQILLEKAGWKDRDGDGVIEDQTGRPFPTVDILISSGGGHEGIAQAISAMWERELRIQGSITVKESKVFADDLKQHHFVVSRANWFGDYGDPTTFLDLFRSTNNNNDRNYKNIWFDELMARTDREPDPDKRMRMLEKAESYIVDDQLPLIPIFHRVTVYMFEPGHLTHISTHPRLTQYLWKLEVVK